MSSGKWLTILLVSVSLVVLLTFSNSPPGDQLEQVRYFTRSLEFNYVSWTINALFSKVNQVALAVDEQLDQQTSRKVVLDYLALIRQIRETEGRLNIIYSDPNEPDPESASQTVRLELDQLHKQRDQLAPLAETVLQDQMSQVMAQSGLSELGGAVPPILYHSTPLPTALIVSPRNVIRQDQNISLVPDLSADKREDLEEKVDKKLDVSSLVVDIGGMGLYPTMVMETDDLNFLTFVVAHEWIHNYLTMRPLGLSYMSSPELRTMNETVAAIAGKELGRAVMERFYPELLPPPPAAPSPNGEVETPEPPEFDFREEMRITRVTADKLLAEGKINEAESYMAERQKVFWDHGYLIRKLNQAYFAFHGAYADEPGGAAGEDPVGAAVRALRTESSSLRQFIDRISWMYSYDQLKRAIGENSA
jgi:hypothetical protein